MSKEYATETTLKGEYRGKPQTRMGTGAYQDPSYRDALTYYFSTGRELITSISHTVTETSCFPSRVCTETAAALVRGEPVLEIYTIDSSAVATALGGLEPEYIHCAVMAELALRRAVLDCVGKRKEGQPVKAVSPM